ncbi:hypothetical protein SLEP1_g53923 [Rubroshorea leprosula]|uniref:Uncharacterized protein n=1 Tax=Rubroshorea leprosula TaxID=152421 RepID=A0AAV5MDN8_9ROSI|nr:hypothetical protein SLEP1_g53923 [Rubroshorea leprosula]
MSYEVAVNSLSTEVGKAYISSSEISHEEKDKIIEDYPRPAAVETLSCKSWLVMFSFS